jgi:hypothetical protein
MLGESEAEGDWEGLALGESDADGLCDGEKDDPPPEAV